MADRDLATLVTQILAVSGPAQAAHVAAVEAGQMPPDRPSFDVTNSERRLLCDHGYLPRQEHVNFSPQLGRVTLHVVGD